MTELIEYLIEMIAPPDPEAHQVVRRLSKRFVDLTGDPGWTKSWPDDSIPGLICQGTPTEEQAAELMRVLTPGAHLMLIAPDEEPTGYAGAVCLEDQGFEIRDAICVAEEAGGLDYIPKAARSEREQALTDEDTSFETGEDGPIKNIHPCLHPDALVMTDRGYRPISEMGIGRRVLSADGRFHVVEHVSNHPYTSEFLYKIAVMGTNYTVLATDNHPFLIWRPIRYRKSLIGGEVMWVEAQELRKGDYTMTPVLAEPEGDDGSGDEYWFLFGLWLAEGIVQKAGHGKNLYPS